MIFIFFFDYHLSFVQYTNHTFFFYRLLLLLTELLVSYLKKKGNNISYHMQQWIKLKDN